MSLADKARLRRRPQPWRILRAVRRRRVRLRRHRAAAEAARPGDAGRRFRSARARWRRCSAPTSSRPRRSPRQRRRARSAPSPTTMTPARSCSRATRARSSAPSRWPRTTGSSAACSLPVSAPFHCSLMQPAAEAMDEALGRVAIDAPPRAAVRQRHRAPVTDPGQDPQPAGRAGHRPRALARERAGDGRSGRRAIRRARRQGARPDGQAHRSRTLNVTSVVDDGRYRSAGEGDCDACSTLPE